MSARKWFVYIVKCADQTLYTGATNDLGKRLQAHNLNQGAKYTRGRTPVTLVYQEKFPNKSAAMSREYQIKQLTRGQKLELVNEKI
jgi:putative endonuclease